MPRHFVLAEVIAETLHALSPSLKGKPHRVVTEIPPDITLQSQPGALGQVIINLVNNAYLHAFEGRDDGVLSISAQAADGWVTIKITDNGRGMSPEQVERLDDPFFSTKKGQGGSGLGMAIVRNLVSKTLGGRVSVNSALGQGTSFTIELPTGMA